MKAILIILVASLAFILIMSLLGFYLAIRPFKFTSYLTPATFGVNYEPVAFRTQDGLLIRGWFIPNVKPAAKTIILLHGYPADKGNVLPGTLYLHHDFNLLYFDFRYFGESEGGYTTIGKNEVNDLLAAIHYLHRRGINEVGVWGLSLGGAVALLTAPEAPAIKAMVIESSYARLDWLAVDYYSIPLLRNVLAQFTRFWARIFLHVDLTALSPARAAEKANIPILLIHSKQDTVVPIKHAEWLQKALQKNPHATIMFTEKNKHGEPIENYQMIIKKFFKDNL